MLSTVEAPVESPREDVRAMTGILGDTPPKRDIWAMTRWSVISRLDLEQDTTAREQSWTDLIEAYRAPMEIYVRRLLGRTRGRTPSADEVSDVVQAFLVECIEKDWLSRADPERGRFRAFIQTLLKRFVFHQMRHDMAQKRQPKDKAVVSLDVGFDPSGTDDAADLEAFDRGWVEVAVQRALDRLREERERYAVVIEDLIRTDGEGSPDLPERVGVRPVQLPVLKHRARERFSKLFEEELASTVNDPQDFEDEWRSLAPFLP